MTITISFRKMNPGALATLASIINHYIEHTTVSFYTEKLSVEDMREKVFFDNPAFQAFLINDGDETIGYCAIMPWKKQQAYRHTGEVVIYLSPAHSGKGIGTQAISYLIEHAKANDIRNLIAGLCSENYPSKKLFEKNGFDQCAFFRGVGQKFGRPLDTLYMQKMIE